MRLIRRSATPGKRQIDLAGAPLRDPLAPLPRTGRVVAPSFDGDGVAVDGRMDHYRELWWRQSSFKAKEITTEAQAEGAIEGSGDDYKVRPHGSSTVQPHIVVGQSFVERGGADPPPPSLAGCRRVRRRL